VHILYLSQYFPPEAGATQTRAYEMARNFVRLGHPTTILTEFPNHPSGVIPLQYHGKIYERSDLDGIDVLRVWVKASPIKNFRNRMLFYLTFMVNATLMGLFLAHDHYDLIYASSPPLFVGGAALVLSYLKRTPLVFEVRDLWPESAVALGEISNPQAIAWATRLEEACYRKARLIIVVTQGIQARLIERNIPLRKVKLIPNGANINLFQFRSEGRERIRTELKLNNKFIAIYAGIHGIAQGLENLIEAANQLREAKDIHFLMIGEGPKKADIAELAARYALSNLTMLPEQPREDMPDYLSAADVAIIPLRNLDLFKGVLPSKLFDAWACQRPVLLSIVDGEARHVMELAGGGICVPPEDPTLIAEALIVLKNQPAERGAMGLRGRFYTVDHYSRQSLARDLADLLGDMVAV
jgi:glycosyltransferase involved in cell wall biosynthesis